MTIRVDHLDAVASSRRARGLISDGPQVPTHPTKLMRRSTPLYRVKAHTDGGEVRSEAASLRTSNGRRSNGRHEIQPVRPLSPVTDS